MMQQLFLLVLLAGTVQNALAAVAVAIGGNGFISKLILYSAKGDQGRPITEIFEDSIIDLAVVGTDLTIVAECDPEVVDGVNVPFPALKWVYNQTGYLDRFRPYTMVGDYEGIARFTPVSYLSSPGFKEIKVTAYADKVQTAEVVGKVIRKFQIIHSKKVNTLAELSVLYLIQSSKPKEEAEVTPITDGFTYNITELTGYTADDQQLLPFSLKAKFNGPSDAEKVEFLFANGKQYSYEGLRDDSTVVTYVAMEDLMQIGKKTVTVNAYAADNTLLISRSYEFTLSY